MKRKRSKVRKAKEVILRVADGLQKSGIDTSRRGVFVGGTKPKLVSAERKERDERAGRHSATSD